MCFQQNIISLLLVFISFGAIASDWSHEGILTLETRQFENDENEKTFESQRSLLVNLKTEKEYSSSSITIDFSARYDDQDRDRSFLWPQEVYYKRTDSDDFDFLIGYKTFNLSYLEVFNPFDEINARIFDVSIVKAEKIGELAMGFELEAWNGSLSIFLLPNPTRPIVPGTESRLNLVQDLNKPVWMGTNDNESDWDDHFLVKYEKTVGNLDFQLVLNKGIDRTRVIIGTDDYVVVGGVAVPQTFDFFTPYYYERYLSGGSFVYNFESWQIKSSIAHSFYLSNKDIFTIEGMKSPVDYTVGALGAEKQFSHSHSYDSIFVIELQYQKLQDEDFREDYALQNDYLFTWKFNFNDLNSKELTFSVLRDLEGKNEGFYQFKYSQRFLSDYRIEFGGVDYEIPDSASFTGYGIFKQAEHVFLNLTFFM